MDWARRNVIVTERVIPELEEWASEPPGAPVELVTQSQPWLIVRLTHNLQGVVGPLGNVLLDRTTGFSDVAYSLMSRILSAKHGLAVLDGFNAQEAEMIASFERDVRRFGPLDRLTAPSQRYGKVTRLMRDAQVRFHDPDGPAITLAGGRQIFMLRGVVVPWSRWELRDDPSRIMKVQNVEVRRVLIERMGHLRFIKELGISPQQHDRFGVLYHIGTDQALVHVTCPSTGQQYFLNVPRGCRSAHEAVAWSFNMLPEDYDPQKEA